MPLHKYIHKSTAESIETSTRKAFSDNTPSVDIYWLYDNTIVFIHMYAFGLA